MAMIVGVPRYVRIGGGIGLVVLAGLLWLWAIHIGCISFETSSTAQAVLAGNASPDWKLGRVAATELEPANTADLGGFRISSGSVTCIDGPNRVWPARADGRCYQEDAPSLPAEMQRWLSSNQPPVVPWPGTSTFGVALPRAANGWACVSNVEQAQSLLRVQCVAY